jgi:hypothetical protein
MAFTVIPILAVTASVVLIGWLYIRLTASRTLFDELPSDWREIRPSRYAPLGRLLAPEDFAYLRTLPGYEPRLEKELMRRRLDAFRLYLAELVRDFDTMQRVGQLMAATGQASPMLREQLLLARIAFTRALWQVRFEMLMFRLGGRPVAADRLLSALKDTCGALQLNPGISGGAA